ncbi:MAG: SoxR reducing system RseC family protein [Peptoniphilus sp.]|uniref:SoxR reducing system RseC family protein n=1 Tax=Peptoniphilus sp. TaxID=1971214 RepID=UPI002A7613D4|nr:SoxR reducing system RseC family protein [Peptoniphilus sp.]MDY2986468.1 SoxR reducing system RseC family protein [Peptoniphilus sp.]
MKNSGIVINVDGDYLDIVSVRESACGGSCESCGAHCESKAETLRLLNTIEAEVGDRVELEINSSKVLGYIGLVYGVPLIIFIISVITSFAILGEANQIWCFLIGLISIAISYSVIRKIDGSLKNTNSEIKIRKISYE